MTRTEKISRRDFDRGKETWKRRGSSNNTGNVCQLTRDVREGVRALTSSLLKERSQRIV